TAAIDSAEISLGDLGVFGSIDVAPQRSSPPDPPNPIVPVVFRVHPAALRAVKLGVGGELTGLVDRIEAHGLAGWGHRNLFGGLGDFQVQVRPGVTLNFSGSSLAKTVSATQPEASGGSAATMSGTEVVRKNNVQVLPEFKLRASLTQPGVLLPLEPKTAGMLN